MNTLTRRQGLGLMAGGLALAQMASPPASAAAPAFKTKIDVKDPVWNRDTYARLDGDLDPTKEKVGWLRGTVYGVRENEPVRPLFVNEGFSVVRIKQLPDGSWRRMLREIVFYRDIATGEILKTWTNPYTKEVVNVVPIANDPFNYTISEFYPDPPSYGGLNKEAPPKRPFLLKWIDGPNDTLVLHTDIHLFYPSGMQPSEWPRESPGKFTRVSELFIFVVNKKDIENPQMTHVPAVGSWSRITPWLPWMLMGNAPGHITYFNTFGTVAGIDALPKDLVEAARAYDPKFLSAPTEDYGPSLSSLENYKRNNKPAPVPDGWQAPQPPPPAGKP